MQHQIDPQLSAPLELFMSLFGGGIDLDDIPKTREQGKQMTAMMREMLPDIEGVSTSDHHAPGPGDESDVFVRIYRPQQSKGNLPGLLWIHGGGYVLGDVEQDDLTAKALALASNCVVASVDYRLAPEHPFPAPLEDCYAALKWFSQSAEDFGVDGSRIAIGGASAGGGLAAGLALLARDRDEVDIAYQLLIYPMIDDRNIAQADDETPDTLVWSRANNLTGWRSYLGSEPGGDDTSPYAAAARAEELNGLPPTYIGVGTLDLFMDENVEYARRLLEAGVPTDLHVYPGGFHAFEVVAPEAVISQRFQNDRLQALVYALHGDQSEGD